MYELTLSVAVAMRLTLTNALERGKAKQRENPESGEILSYLLMMVGMVALAVLILAGIKLWATGKLGDLTAN